MQTINQILKTIDGAITDFQGSVPGMQKIIMDELQPLIKGIEIRNGRILNNVNNLKLIGLIKNKLQKVIVSAEYKDKVNKFLDSYTAIADMQASYFSQFVQKFTPSKTLPLIKNLAIETTVNDLVGQGMSASVVDPIVNIITQNTTTGGSYSDFNLQLQNEILNNETGDGSLVRYTKQITTDAVNQFAAQYSDAIAQDLQFDWMQYVGSLITTSREFCILLTEKRWIHRSELPGIIAGEIDGHQCKLSKKTKLPLGMIPDTNATNFNIRRGGYLCGHQAFWVPDSAVPPDLLAKFPRTGTTPPAAAPPKPAAPVPPPVVPPVRTPVATPSVQSPTPVSAPSPAPVPPAAGGKPVIRLDAYPQNFKTLKEIQDVLTHAFNADTFNQFFTNAKFHTLSITRVSGRNGETYGRGDIALSKAKTEQFISGMNKIKNQEDLNHDEEKAFATFWHEVWHNTNKDSSYTRRPLTKLSTRYMELGNEFVARKTLDTVFETFGTTLKDTTLKTNRNDTSYNTMVRNYDFLIKFYGIDEKIVINYMVDKMKNGNYSDVKEYLAEALMAGKPDLGRRDALKAVNDAVTNGESVMAYVYDQKK